MRRIVAQDLHSALLPSHGNAMTRSAIAALVGKLHADPPILENSQSSRGCGLHSLSRPLHRQACTWSGYPGNRSSRNRKPFKTRCRFLIIFTNSFKTERTCHVRGNRPKVESAIVRLCHGQAQTRQAHPMPPPRSQCRIDFLDGLAGRHSCLSA